MTELAPDLGGFHSILCMTHDQFMELLTYVEPTIIGCDTMMRECITPHEMLVVTHFDIYPQVCVTCTFTYTVGKASVG